MLLNQGIKKKIQRIQILTLYKELLKKESIKRGYQEVYNVTDIMYLINLKKNILKIKKNEHLLISEILY